MGNHDTKRMTTKKGAQYASVLNMLLLLLPGTPTTYQGEEFGMLDTQVSFEETQDPRGKNFGPVSSHTCIVSLCKTSIFTARKRGLRRLCFYTCLSVHGGGVCPSACWDIPPTPTPGTRGRHPPPGAVHAGRYGQQAGGTHPTGMHTC